MLCLIPHDLQPSFEGGEVLAFHWIEQRAWGNKVQYLDSMLKRTSPSGVAITGVRLIVITLLVAVFIAITLVIVLARVPFLLGRLASLTSTVCSMRLIVSI